MQCTEFNRLLPRLLSGTVTQTERDSCEAHMQDCAHCVASFALASAARFEPQDSDALLQRIVQATTPELCATSTSLLCDLLDASLGPDQTVLLTSHLEDCGYCQQLYNNLQSVRSDLPLLTELQPPGFLLARILQQTSHQIQPETSWLLSALDRIRLVMLRPRIALEVSFATTLVWTFVFGVPTSILDTSFAEPSAVFERLQIQNIWQEAQTGVERGLAGFNPDLSRPVAAITDTSARLVHDNVENVQATATELWRSLADQVDGLRARLSLLRN